MPRADGKAAMATQRAVLRAAHNHALDHGTWPTARRLAASLGLANDAVWRALKALRRRGLVDWDAQQDRGVRVAGVRLQLVYGEGAEKLFKALYPKWAAPPARGEGKGDEQ